VKNPLLVTLRKHPKAVGQLMGYTMLSTLCYYTFFSTLTPFAINARKASAGDVFLALSIGTALFIALQYPMGMLSDRYGRNLSCWSGRRPRRCSSFHCPH
jgi:MHS family alpha-ketoglutarate permease-like MFS transporter